MRGVSTYGNSQERLHRTDSTTVQLWKIRLGHEEGIIREKKHEQRRENESLWAGWCLGFTGNNWR